MLQRLCKGPTALCYNSLAGKQECVTVPASQVLSRALVRHSVSVQIPETLCLILKSHLHAAANAARSAEVLVQLHHRRRAVPRILHQVAHHSA